jgi:Xaa-Pro aminopeptidase
MARERFTNTARWRAIMAKAQLSAVIVASPGSIFYTTGALLSAQLKASPSPGARLVDDRTAFALVPEDGEPTVIVSSRDVASIREGAWTSRIECYDDTRGSAVEILADVLRRSGLARERLGVETAYITAADMMALERASLTTQLIPCDAEINLVRAVKTRREIDILQKAGEATAEAIWEGFRGTRAGETEKQLADRIAAALFRKGADDIYLAVLGAGENTFHTHNKPGERTLRRGDLVRTDQGGKFEGFASDLARMGVVGEPTAAQESLYKVCREVQLATIDTIRVGAEARDVYQNCKRLFAEAGFQLTFPHVGHAFALGGHD